MSVRLSSLDSRGNPVINTPYEEPRRHWELDLAGRAIECRPPKQGRRPSHGILPVPTTRKGQPVQGVLELNPDDLNETVEEIRVHLRRWRDRRWEGATGRTRRLLAYWTRDNRHLRPFFAQLEAVETVIWLTETDQGRRYARSRIAPLSQDQNEGIIRWATKMATGTGKTMVMAMLVVWHTLNDVRRPARRGRAGHPYTSAFLAITPGHTVRERLGELAPSHPDNVYDRMDLVPPSLRFRLNRAQVAIVNFQAFQRRDLLSGVSGDGRKVLDPQGESGVEDAAVMLDRVLRGLKGRNRLLVFNDEAHHCYNPSFGAANQEDQKIAGVWFNALRALKRQNRLLAVYDFSATPMFISTAAKKHGGELFPWVVSDFPLLEAIESGLVKIPRLPVDDDAEGFDVKWRALYKHAKPKTVTREKLPGLLEDALTSLYADWWLEWERWRKAGRRTPPVFIVVANSIANARALYEYIGGYERTDQQSGRTEYVRGALAEFSNIRLEGTGWKENPVTLLMHSKLDSGDKVTGALAKLVKAQAARLSGARRRAGQTDDVSLLRNVLNTVGREGEPGEHIRCVISVSMLTEGWDTRTVTHVLGYRAFSTQLLCEQVTGRALRRADYESFDSEGRLTPEYSQVLGIPFDFMPGKPVDPPTPNTVYMVRTMVDRARLRIELPQLSGYAWKPATGRLRLHPDRVEPYDVTVIDRPTLAELGGVIGETELVGIDEVRFQQAAWRLAAECTTRVVAQQNGAEAVYGKGRLFADLRRAVEEWLAHPDVACADPRVLMQRPHFEEAVGRVVKACIGDEEGPTLVGTFDSDTPVVVDTSSINFETTLSNRYPSDEHAGRATVRSEINIAACHSRLETVIAELLDTHFPQVDAWIRNFRLGWDIPYLYDGVWHSYEPDFVARLYDQTGNPVHLIVECKGQPDEQSAAKARYVTDWWTVAVRNSPQIPAGLSRWGFSEITDEATAGAVLGDAIAGMVRSGSTVRATTTGRE